MVIVLDVARRLATDVTLPKIMKEGRRYGVAVVVASQGLWDFHADVVGNAGAKASLRVNRPDSRKVAEFLRSQGGQEVARILKRLRLGQALVETPEIDGGRRTNMRLPRSAEANHGFILSATSWRRVILMERSWRFGHMLAIMVGVYDANWGADR